MDINELSLKHLFPVPRHSKGLTSAELSRLEAIGLARCHAPNWFSAVNMDKDSQRTL